MPSTSIPPEDRSYLESDTENSEFDSDSSASKSKKKNKKKVDKIKTDDDDYEETLDAVAIVGADGSINMPNHAAPGIFAHNGRTEGRKLIPWHREF